MASSFPRLDALEKTDVSSRMAYNAWVAAAVCLIHLYQGELTWAGVMLLGAFASAAMFDHDLNRASRQHHQ